MKAAITVIHPREEVERRWAAEAGVHPAIDEAGANVTFTDAPGGRGTEIHVDLEPSGSGGALEGIVDKLKGASPLAKAKDELRHFKQIVETGQIVRSDGSPEGEQAERKLKQRPAQPLEQGELDKAGAR